MDAWEERGQKWPYESSRLETLAFRTGMDPDELRESLRRQIAARHREFAAENQRDALVHARRFTAGRAELEWLASLSESTLDEVAAAVAALA